MPTRPSDLPQWATGAGASVTEPPDQSKGLGWQRGVPPVAGWMNWLLNNIYEWLVYFNATVLVFDDLEEAIASLAVGDLCVVYEDDTAPATEAIEVQTAYTATTFLDADIDTCGDIVVICGGDNDPMGVGRDLDGAENAGTPDVSYARTNTGTCTAVRTNGTYTVTAYGQYVECFNATTGASVWVYDNGVGDSPIDMCISRNRVLFVTTTTAGGYQLICLNLTTGAVVWSFDHNAASLYAIATNGHQVFVVGAASGHASGANFRAINFDNGRDATGEGVNGIDPTGRAWNQVLASVAAIAALACDGQFVFLGRDSGAANQVSCYAAGDGSNVWNIAHPDGTLHCRHLVVDQDYVICCMSDDGTPAEGYLEARDKRTGALVWRWAASDETATHTACMAACSDGQAIFAIAEDEARIWRITRGNVPVRMRRVNTSTEHSRYRTLKLQPEAQ